MSSIAPDILPQHQVIVSPQGVSDWKNLDQAVQSIWNAAQACTQFDRDYTEDSDNEGSETSPRRPCIQVSGGQSGNAVYIVNYRNSEHRQVSFVIKKAPVSEFLTHGVFREFVEYVSKKTTDSKLHVGTAMAFESMRDEKTGQEQIKVHDFSQRDSILSEDHAFLVQDALALLCRTPNFLGESNAIISEFVRGKTVQRLFEQSLDPRFDREHAPLPNVLFYQLGLMTSLDKMLGNLDRVIHYSRCERCHTHCLEHGEQIASNFANMMFQTDQKDSETSLYLIDNGERPFDNLEQGLDWFAYNLNLAAGKKDDCYFWEAFKEQTFDTAWTCWKQYNDQELMLPTGAKDSELSSSEIKQNAPYGLTRSAKNTFADGIQAGARYIKAWFDESDSHVTWIGLAIRVRMKEKTKEDTSASTAWLNSRRRPREPGEEVATPSKFISRRVALFKKEEQAKPLLP